MQILSENLSPTIKLDEFRVWNVLPLLFLCNGENRVLSSWDFPLFLSDEVGLVWPFSSPSTPVFALMLVPYSNTLFKVENWGNKHQVNEVMRASCSFPSLLLFGKVISIYWGLPLTNLPVTYLPNFCNQLFALTL